MTDQGGTFTAEQAAQAVGQVQAADQGTDAGPTIEEMQQAAVRAALGQFEQQLADQMSKAQAAFTSQSATIEALTRQLATVRAQAGPPSAALLAESLATRIGSIAAANPDLGGQHFAGVLGQAQGLAEEVKAAVAGQGEPGRVEQLAHGVIQFFERVHPRRSGKVLEGAHAAVDEAERIIEEAAKLAPAAVSIVQAL